MSTELPKIGEERADGTFYDYWKYCDIVVHVRANDSTEVRMFWSHRVILAQSEYLEHLIDAASASSFNRTVSIELPDLPPKYFEMYMEFLYGKTPDFSNLNFSECFQLYTETARFKTNAFSKRIRDRIDSLYLAGLTNDESIVYYEFSAIHGSTVINPKIDVPAEVICSLSYEAVKYLLKPYGPSAYILAMVWIASHPEAPDEQKKFLLANVKASRPYEGTISFIMTYRVLPILHDIIFELMDLALANQGDRAYLGLFTTYPQLLEIKKTIDAKSKGMTVESK